MINPSYWSPAWHKSIWHDEKQANSRTAKNIKMVKANGSLTFLTLASSYGNCAWVPNPDSKKKKHLASWFHDQSHCPLGQIDSGRHDTSKRSLGLKVKPMIESILQNIPTLIQTCTTSEDLMHTPPKKDPTIILGNTRDLLLCVD